MTPETTYLELSQDSGSAHKFYEVTVTDTTVTIRYGRIGTPGQTQTQQHPTPAKAQAEAAKKIRDKQRDRRRTNWNATRHKNPQSTSSKSLSCLYPPGNHHRY